MRRENDRMGGWWTSLPSAELGDDRRTVVLQALDDQGCAHWPEVSAATLDHWPELLRITCSRCPLDVVFKFFSNHNDLERELEGHRLLGEVGLTSGRSRVALPLYVTTSPRPALVHHYLGHPDFFVAVQKILESGDETLLVGALTQLAETLSILHRRSTDCAPLVALGQLASVQDCLELLQDYRSDATFGEIASRLLQLQDEWRARPSGGFPTSLVHGDLGPGHVLWDPDRGELLLIDLESVHRDSFLVDIGTVTAEAQVSVLGPGRRFGRRGAIHWVFSARILLEAERPYRGVPRATMWQAYFMGQRFVFISRLEMLDERGRCGCLETAERIWGAVRRERSKGRLSPQTRTILFDFYNTLVVIDADEDSAESYEEVLRRVSEVLDRSTVPSLSGSELRDLLTGEVVRLTRESEEQYPEVDLRIAWLNVLSGPEVGVPLEWLSRNGEELLRDLMARYRRFSIRDLHLVPGALEILGRLDQHGLRLGVVSNAQTLFLDDELARSGLSPLLDCVVVSGAHGFRKPDPRLFRLALERLHTDPAEAVFVGDNLSEDILGAQGVGLRAIYIHPHYGQTFCKDCTPDDVLAGLSDLPAYLGIA